MQMSLGSLTPPNAVYSLSLLRSMLLRESRTLHAGYAGR